MKCMLFLFATFSFLDAPSPTPLEVRTAAFSSRMTITSGEIDIDVDYKMGSLQKKLRTKAWLDKQNFRRDTDDAMTSGQKFRESFVLNEKEYVYFTTNQGASKKPLAMKVLSKAFYSEEESKRFLDMRRIGVAPIELLMGHHYDLRDVLAPNAIADESIEKSEINGLSCWKVQYTTNDKTKYALWICPDRGHALLRVLLRSNPAVTDYVAATQSEYESFGQPPVWFPTRVHFTATEGGRVTREEKALIKVHSINQPIAPTVFTIAGINPPVGTVASVQPSTKWGAYLVWDGNQLKPMEKPTLYTSPALDDKLPSEPFWTVPKIAILIACGGLVFVAIWKVRHRQQ